VINAAADRTRAADAAQELQRQGARLLTTLGTIPTLTALEVIQIPVVYCKVGALDATGLGRPGGPSVGRGPAAGSSAGNPHN